jgi:PAS domain S-box-containing protein
MVLDSGRVDRSGDLLAGSDLPNLPEVEEERGTLSDRHRKRRRHDCSGGREGTTLVQQSGVQANPGRILESLASTIRDAQGEVAKLVIVNRDITERKQAEQKLEHHLFHDPLTDLPNRRLFLDHLQNSFVRAQRDSDRP